jgi:hypothetical protein
MTYMDKMEWMGREGVCMDIGNQITLLSCKDLFYSISLWCVLRPVSGECSGRPLKETYKRLLKCW